MAHLTRSSCWEPASRLQVAVFFLKQRSWTLEAYNMPDRLPHPQEASVVSLCAAAIVLTQWLVHYAIRMQLGFQNVRSGGKYAGPDVHSRSCGWRWWVEWRWLWWQCGDLNKTQSKRNERESCEWQEDDDDVTEDRITDTTNMGEVEKLPHSPAH